MSLITWIANADRLARMAAGHERHPGWIGATGPVFGEAGKELLLALRKVAQTSDLPDEVRVRLEALVVDCSKSIDGLTQPLDVMAFAMRLNYIVGILDSADASSETPRRNRVERAFEHLNRSLIVDPELQRRWKTAFGNREEECEKLGAVHLLLHGVFAFKANSTGGRTDLVIGGNLEITPGVLGSDVLALTEWKVVSNEREVPQKALAARHQAEMYSTGVLAGVELAHTRFLVLVSRLHLARIPDDIIEGTILYRHINVVLEPLPPSKAASRRGRTGTS